jgi:hypothetical protein
MLAKVSDQRSDLLVYVDELLAENRMLTRLHDITLNHMQCIANKYAAQVFAYRDLRNKTAGVIESASLQPPHRDQPSPKSE